MGATTEPLEVSLRETPAQHLLLVLAAEELDREGRWLPRRLRREASREAQGNGVEDPRWLVDRSRRLITALEARQPHLRRWLAAGRPFRGALVPVAAIALGLGLATQALGPERQVSLLAVPLLALVLWNVVVVALSLVARALPLAAAGSSWSERIVGWGARRAADQASRSGALAGGVADSSDGELWGRIAQRFVERWLVVTTPLAVARLRRLLHLGALLMVAGAVAGMYLRGLVYEFRVGWESTFLDAEAVDGILGWLLGPAATVLGWQVPSVVGLDGPAGGDAAPWIHLWAVTAALFVGLPRGLLLLVEHLRVARLERRLKVTLDPATRRRLQVGGDRRAHGVEIVPYSHTPSEAALAATQELLYDFLGPRSEVRCRAMVPYGDPAPESGDGVRLVVVLFSLAQTPEVEVHGEWLRALVEEAAADRSLLVWVDRGPLRKRLGDLPERLEERARSWRRVVRDAGLEALDFDLETARPEEVLPRSTAAVWPKGSLADP